MSDDLKHKIESLRGPILVLGASGFIGANILGSSMSHRCDTYGTASKLPSWRVPKSRWLIVSNLSDPSNLYAVINHVQPRTIFNCISYGAYPFQTDFNKMLVMNFGIVMPLVDYCNSSGSTLIHAGTSSEYGKHSAAPLEETTCFPVGNNYAITKLYGSSYISNHGTGKCATLRLYSVYGPYEDGSRLIPQVIQCGLRGFCPQFTQPDISRDFIYVDDVVESFLDAALNLKPEDYGDSFNIGTGVKTTIEDIAKLSKKTFDIKSMPSYSMPPRLWDHCNDWYANPSKAKERLGWEYKTSLEEGIDKTVQWFKSQGNGWEWPSLRPLAGSQSGSPKEKV